MGHFSVPCGMSGIPITAGQPIVGFRVENTRFEDSTYWDKIPCTIPVRGFYDDYGRLEDSKGNTLLSPDDSQIVLIHEELWDAIPDMWDNKYDKWPPMIESVRAIVEYFKKAKERGSSLLAMIEESSSAKEALGKKGITPDDYKFNTYHELSRAIDSSSGHRLNSFKHLFSKICFSGPATEDVGDTWHTGEPRLFPKGQMMCFNLILNWEETPEDEREKIVSELEKLTLCYLTSNIRGRQVTTTHHCYTIQDSDYKFETKWRRKVSGFVGKLRKKITDREKHCKTEEAFEDFEEACKKIAKKYGLKVCNLQYKSVEYHNAFSTSEDKEGWVSQDYRDKNYEAMQEMKALKDFKKFKNREHEVEDY